MFMDSLLFIIGIVVIIVSTIMIVRAKKRNLEGSENSEYIERPSRSKTYRDEVDFTEEEVEFISNFDSRDKAQRPKSDDFDTTLRESEGRDILDSSRVDYGQSYDRVEQTGEETDKKEAIYILYKDGLTSPEIAKKLEMGRREVEIILKVKGLIK